MYRSKRGNKTRNGRITLSSDGHLMVRSCLIYAISNKKKKNGFRSDFWDGGMK